MEFLGGTGTKTILPLVIANNFRYGATQFSPGGQNGGHFVDAITGKLYSYHISLNIQHIFDIKMPLPRFSWSTNMLVQFKNI